MSYQIWIIHAETGPVEPYKVIHRDALEDAIFAASAMLREHCTWFGVGIKAEGELSWAWVTYRDTPLFDGQGNRATGQQGNRHVEALPMELNPVGGVARSHNPQRPRRNEGA